MKLGEKLKYEGCSYRLVYGQLDCNGCAFNSRGPIPEACKKFGACGKKLCVDRTISNQPVFGKFKRIYRRGNK